MDYIWVLEKVFPPMAYCSAMVLLHFQPSCCIGTFRAATSVPAVCCDTGKRGYCSEHPCAAVIEFEMKQHHGGMVRTGWNGLGFSQTQWPPVWRLLT